MILLKDVTKTYSKQTRALEQVNLELKKGGFLYVIGGSGAGKSTLLRLLATEEEPTLGTVSLFSYDLAQASSQTLRAIRRSIGYIPQDVRLIRDLSVFENIMLSLSLSHQQQTLELKNDVDELLSKLGLIHKKNHLVQSLSGGEAQRVAIARALGRRPELLIADEPTGAQDKENTWAVMDLFQKANASGITVIIATHDREIVKRIRKPAIYLKAGRLPQEGSQCIY